MANFLVYDFIMATQTESNDVGLDAKSCSSVHYFTAATTCLLSTNANEIPSLRLCVQRMSRYFQYPGTAPAFPLFHPRPHHSHSLFPSSGKAKGDANPDTVTTFRGNEFR